MKASRFNGIGEGADDGLLANDLIECLGPEPESNDTGFIHRRGVTVFGLPAGVSICKIAGQAPELPRHIRLLLPLLRSRPGGVHRTCVVRSPKSDTDIVTLTIADCQLPIVDLRANLRCDFIGQHFYTAVLRWATIRSNPLIPKCKRM